MKPAIAEARWIKSRSCSTDGCVEVAQLSDGLVAIRDSKDVAKAPHVFDRHEWAAFISGAKNGEFDLPVS